MTGFTIAEVEGGRDKQGQPHPKTDHSMEAQAFPSIDMFGMQSFENEDDLDDDENSRQKRNKPNEPINKFALPDEPTEPTVSFSITCEVMNTNLGAQERARLLFTICPRFVKGTTQEMVNRVPLGFRKNCIHENPMIPTPPIQVPLLPTVGFNTNTVSMVYNGTVRLENGVQGNSYAKTFQNYGGMYTTKDQDITPPVKRKTVEFDSAALSGKETNDGQEFVLEYYKLMIGHQYTLILDEPTYQQLISIRGWIDTLVASSFLCIYNQIQSVANYYSSNQNIMVLPGWPQQLMQTAFTRFSSPQDTRHFNMVDETLDVIDADGTFHYVFRTEPNPTGSVIYVYGETITENFFSSGFDAMHEDKFTTSSHRTFRTLNEKNTVHSPTLIFRS